ncbi:hypothetical protein BX600DRAFT_438725 [Xylariales sp. PMI_506]|nr:hypothetical protein BX600DRAFT_438725 [Xylariales sp. PMI_506]
MAMEPRSPPGKSTGEPGVAAIKHATLKYTRKIKKFAYLADGRGANHQLLVTYFGKLDDRWSKSPHLSSTKQRFALSYTFGKPHLCFCPFAAHEMWLESEGKSDQSEAKWVLNKAVEYESCLDFVVKTKSETSKSPSRLLFLRGVPSVEWLGIIGTKYKIDPEFFMRFLHFKFATNIFTNYSLPALPAATWNILELPIITTGRRKVVLGPLKQIEVDAMRREVKSNLQAHHDRLQENSELAVASSVVRDISIIDHIYFALEQRIWICLQPNISQNDSGNPRWSLIIWTDAGRTPGVKSILDLNLLPTEFQTGPTSLLPVIDYKGYAGLAAEKFESDDLVTPVNGAESTSQLCIGYGRTLHDDIMATDPLYALTEVFKVATASVNQYLNVIEQKLEEFTDDKTYDDLDVLTNLRYLKNLLYQQERQLKQVSSWLEPRETFDPSGWRTTGQENLKASQAFKSVIHRYEYLHTRVQTLQGYCKDAISDLMNMINSKEMKNSYKQSERIGKLTFLAFVFAPLSFTTSFFAMNIGLENLTLTKWFIVTVILLSTTFFVMFVDISSWMRMLRRKIHNLLRKAQYI